MSEVKAIQKAKVPVTLEIIKTDLRKLGIESGDILLVHSSLSKLGWVCGGPQTVIMALLEVLGDTGTLVMPSHSGDWSDPTHWAHPPVPSEWISIIKSSMPAYNPLLTASRGMGRIAELFRTLPSVKRSMHPQLSFSAHGPLADQIIDGKILFPQLGMDSPLGKLYQNHAKVLLLGVGYDSNTSFHLAETLIPSISKNVCGAAMMVDGHREWHEFTDINYDSSDFIDCGKAFDKKYTVSKDKVGYGTARCFRIEDAVNFAIEWISQHRKP